MASTKEVIEKCVRVKSISQMFYDIYTLIRHDRISNIIHYITDLPSNIRKLLIAHTNFHETDNILTIAIHYHKIEIITLILSYLNPQERIEIIFKSCMLGRFPNDLQIFKELMSYLTIELSYEYIESYAYSPLYNTMNDEDIPFSKALLRLYAHISDDILENHRNNPIIYKFIEDKKIDISL